MKILTLAIKCILILLTFSACHRGMICPAFQSSFILDDSVRLVTFSLFGPDSLPKNFLVEKGKFGIMEPYTLPQKYNSIKSIQMVTVFPPNVHKDTAYTVPTDSTHFQISELGDQK